MPVDLFQSLHGYSTIADESCLTWSFVRVLRRLRELEPVAAVRLLDDVADWPAGAEFASERGVAIETQVTVAEGGPDLIVRAPARLPLRLADARLGLQAALRPGVGVS